MTYTNSLLPSFQTTLIKYEIDLTLRSDCMSSKEKKEVYK